MTKKLICFGCASLGLLMLSACGSTSPVTVDQSHLWPTGANTNNAVQTGGYWFSYTDHVQWMINNTGWVPSAHIPQQGASLTPLTSLTVSMPVTKVPSDATHPYVMEVSGYTPEAPDWTSQVLTGLWFDTYYQQSGLYPDALLTAYPVAGFGFGFQHDNALFDPSNKGQYVGVIFDMKTLENTVSVDAQLSVVCSENNGDDLNDPTFSDAFPRPGCIYSKITTTPSTPLTEGSDYGTEQVNNTCFAYMHKMFMNPPDGQWATYCVLWNELALPSWVTGKPPAWNDDTLKNCSSKLKWEMDKTAAVGQNPPAVSKFDVSITNVILITREQAAAASSNCNVANLPADKTKLIGPTASGDAG